jgi:asparagine synthase (glutamine-hydrolysing)
VCGLFGIARPVGNPVTLDDRTLESLRDTLTHRGPDGAGLWRKGNVALAHRRLAVIDPTPAGAQPMLTPDGRFALVYNGEIYNDGECRRDLERAGVHFRTACDTETVLWALAEWGVDALRRLRGMFALAFLDVERQNLILARDPLGIKPLYWWRSAHDGCNELVFASETAAILAHPAVEARPDPVVISSYLTTIRLVLGERTLFSGIRTLRPGQVLTFDLTGDLSGETNAPLPTPEPQTTGDAVDAVRDAVTDSVRRHLRADVPTCCLLSGGLDSTIIATIAHPLVDDLTTFCSGAATSGEDDLAVARRVAAQMGLRHIEHAITRERFARRWTEMVEARGEPLSTPNEIAINAIARTLADDGKVVTVSGEGADELFGGYAIPMASAASFVRNGGDRHGLFQLISNAWVPLEQKRNVLREAHIDACAGDEPLIRFYEEEFDALLDGHEDPIQGHLRFHRRVNLAGLLQRLDTATMLESVEGRTPLADAEIAALAESLPIDLKFRTSVSEDPARTETKIILRRAFADAIPDEVLRRPKASFPLPFQDWVADSTGVLRASAFARDLFQPETIDAVCADPKAHWQYAWPMINLAIWGRRWWG